MIQKFKQTTVNGFNMFNLKLNSNYGVVALN